MEDCRRVWPDAPLFYGELAGARLAAFRRVLSRGARGFRHLLRSRFRGAEVEQFGVYAARGPCLRSSCVVSGSCAQRTAGLGCRVAALSDRSGFDRIARQEIWRDRIAAVAGHAAWVARCDYCRSGWLHLGGGDGAGNTAPAWHNPLSEAVGRPALLSRT